MSNNKRASLAVITLIITTTLISACTQSLSQAPAATPTLIATGLFVSPFPSVENPMAMIEEFAKQTAAAQTIAAGGTVETGTPIDGVNETPEVTNTPSESVIDEGTPTNANALVIDTPIPVATSLPSGVRPASYTLQKGEFPYCIARRFNVDPNDLLINSGLNTQQAYSLVAGTVLTIPQSGSFPANRALQPHPATYSVVSGEETVYSIACKYGDVDPNAIASANNMTASTKLTVGQQLQIP